MKLLMVDNYDSFTYNIVQYFGELGAQVTVVRNDETTVAEVEAHNSRFICVCEQDCPANAPNTR